jgi:hypothetical protein
VGTSAKTIAEIDDIYGDLVGDVGKYVPAELTSTSTVAASSSITTTAIFQTTSSSSSTDPDNGIKENDDLMAPVRALLRSQAEEEKLNQEKLERASLEGIQSTKAVPTKPRVNAAVIFDDIDTSNKIHRSVFDAEVSVKAKKADLDGDAMGYGAYEVDGIFDDDVRIHYFFGKFWKFLQQNVIACCCVCIFFSCGRYITAKRMTTAVTAWDTAMSMILSSSSTTTTSRRSPPSRR